MQVEDRLARFVEELVKGLVDAPDAVCATGSVEGRVVMLKVHVAARDVSRVIGKGGRTARSLRTILAASAGKYQKSCFVEFREVGA